MRNESEWKRCVQVDLVLLKLSVKCLAVEAGRGLA